ncbi:MAG: UbiA family prenyltransferase [Candidatus Poseidoniia archaeon]|nr:UbiA family prenyltransferase [Candidatus Poseidoniia archaeon]
MTAVQKMTAARNWWDLSRGGNVVMGIMTIALGALIMGVNYQESVLPLALHAFCIGAFIAGWFAINDLLDIEVDRINHPGRPLPSEDIAETAARKYGHRMMILSSLILVGIIIYDEKGIGAFAWVDSVIVWLVALIMMIAYELDGKPFNPCLKKRMLWGNLIIAGTVFITILFGAAAIGHATEPVLWMISAGAMVLIMAREVSMDIHDHEGDFDRTTLARVAGVEKARKAVWILAFSSFLLMTIPFALELLPTNMVILMLPSFFCALAVKPFLTKEKDAEVASLLRGAMIFGLLGLAGCGIIING